MISLLLPTRKRPRQLQKMVESVREMSQTAPEIVVYIDADDIESVEKTYKLNIISIVGPKLIFTDYWNKCYEKSTGDILMMAADDLIFRTPKWDVMVEDEFKKWKDKIILAYADISLNLSIIPSYPLIHRRWAEAVGYFSPPYFECGSCDYWLNDVAKFLNRKRPIPFILEQHPIIHEFMHDELKREIETNSKRPAATALYMNMTMERLGDAAKLQEVIDKSALIL